MPNKKDHILFVSHKANRSGAPALLLEIIKATRQSTNTPISIISMEDGELVNDFRKLGKTYVWRKGNISQRRLFTTLYQRALQIIRGLIILYQTRKASLVFYNTIVNGHMQKKLSYKPRRSICYVHELQAAIRMLTNEEGRKYTLQYTDLFLCVSEAVKNNLVSNYNISPEKIRVVASPVKETNRDKQQYSSYISSFRQQYKTGDACIIGIVAGNEWRKGIDLLVPLVTLFFTQYPSANIYFAWKGFRKDHYTAFYDMYDYQKCLYKERILLLSHGNDSIEQMACFDIHLLLSREDPYPLVVLEAATLGIPTVCFGNAGGAPEFVEEDSGFVIPYIDLATMAARLYELAENKDLEKQLGDNSRRKVMEKHNEQQCLKVITGLILHDAVPVQVTESNTIPATIHLTTK